MAGLPSFPSLVLRAHALIPQGAFAEAQAEFLQPDSDSVVRLDALLEAQQIGVVAHFYMDPEIQGVLSALRWPHVHISDSLLMADAAVSMVTAGAKAILVLGVDFMSENVRALLDASGHGDVPVYRVAEAPIGCSLAESAQAPAYGAYLAKAAKTPRSLHVIYINTGLDVKARAHHRVPTLTCTSSNVVASILQASAQISGLHVWFGPDTYMGQNLRALLTNLSEMDSTTIQALHPAHSRDSIQALLGRFHYFEQGICIVHHMFGARVVDAVSQNYPEADVAAHLEVPGEMFQLALRRKAEGRGVVGSTSDILNFITSRVQKNASPSGKERLQFVLGTEAGMITSIVQSVQKILRDGRSPVSEVEIVFPVASDAVTVSPDSPLGIVPGVAGGEGCSTEGGCATCPYMKMNSLDALFSFLERRSVAPSQALEGFFPKTYTENIAGRSIADLGSEPILHMRAFQKTGRLPQPLVKAIERAFP